MGTSGKEKGRIGNKNGIRKKYIIETNKVKIAIKKNDLNKCEGILVSLAMLLKTYGDQIKSITVPNAANPKHT